MFTLNNRSARHTSLVATLIVLALLMVSVVIPASAAPGPFVLLTPPDDSIFTPEAPPLNFTWSTADGGANLQYEFKLVRISDDPETVVFTAQAAAENLCDGNTCTGTVPQEYQDDLTCGEYEWVVKAVGADGETPATNNPFSFTVYCTCEGNDLVINGNFETDANGNKVPDVWKDSLLSSDKLTNKVAHSGLLSFRFKGSVLENSGIKQVIVNGNTVKLGDGLKLCVWLRGKNVGVAGWVVAKIQYASGATEKIRIEVPVGTFNWSFFEEGKVMAEDVAKIVVQLRYTGGVGQYFADDVQLIHIP